MKTTDKASTARKSSKVRQRAIERAKPITETKQRNSANREAAIAQIRGELRQLDANARTESMSERKSRPRRSHVAPADDKTIEILTRGSRSGRFSRRRNPQGHVVGQTYQDVFMYSPQTKIDLIKEGIPAVHLGQLSTEMKMPKDYLIDVLGLSRATVNRKVRENKPLSQEESERVLGIESLIGQVETIVKESGNPEGFDAAKWVANWMNAPLPALGGKTPATYMDTVEGQKLVSSILSMAQTGAYA